jgi:hypothetical protein
MWKRGHDEKDVEVSEETLAKILHIKGILRGIPFC